MNAAGRLFIPLAALIALQCGGGTAAAAQTASACGSLSVALVHEFGTVRGADGSDPPCTLALSFPQSANPGADAGSVTLSTGQDGLAVQFNFPQSSAVLDRGVVQNDALWVSLSKDAAGTPYFTAIVDANANCMSSRGQTVQRWNQNECSVTKSHAWSSSANQQYWSGTLTLPADAIDASASDRASYLRVVRYLYRGRDAIPASAHTGITISRTTAMRGYAAFGPHFGNNRDSQGRPEVPPHRIVVSAYAPITPNLLLASAFSDDAGQALSIRQTVLKGAVDTKTARAYVCHTCITFQTDPYNVFDAPFTSADILHVDFSKLGVDDTPFTFDSASYPIDAGYKLYAASGSFHAGIATFEGTSPDNGHASDTIARMVDELSAGNAGRILLGFTDAVANRSLLSQSTGTYPALPSPELHSADMQLSAGFTFRLRPLDANEQFEQTPLLNGLLRYGTQGKPNAQTFDLALGGGEIPALVTADPTGQRNPFSIAVGYRSVGQNYNPLDGNNDVHTGQHGYYGSTNWHLGADTKRQSFDLTLMGYSFSDAAQVRDQATHFEATYTASKMWSMKSTLQNGTIAAAVVARSNNFALSDAQGGALMLPNKILNPQVTYTAPSKTLQLTGGYAWADNQDCNVQLTATVPCYAFTVHGPTGGMHWVVFPNFNALSDLFVEASYAQSATSLFPTAFGANSIAAQSANISSTANRKTTTYALGTHILTGMSSCSTLLATYANRGGDANHFAQSAPQPGSTFTASLDIVPTPNSPSLLVAYSQVNNTDKSKPKQTLFLVRLQFATDMQTYSDAVASTC